MWLKMEVLAVRVDGELRWDRNEIRRVSDLHVYTHIHTHTHKENIHVTQMKLMFVFCVNFAAVQALLHVLSGLGDSGATRDCGNSCTEYTLHEMLV